MLKTTLIGHIGKDAKQIISKSNKNFIGFTVGINEKDRENPTWINITCSYAAFEKVIPYLTKGKQIYVEGKPYVGTYSKNDEIFATLNLIAHNIQLLDNKNDCTNQQVAEQMEQGANLPY